MKVYELLSFNKELISKFYNAGVNIGDYRYIELYNEYIELKNNGEKVTYIVDYLSNKYNVSERHIYDIAKRMSQEVVLQNLCSDK